MSARGWLFVLLASLVTACIGPEASLAVAGDGGESLGHDGGDDGEATGPDADGHGGAPPDASEHDSSAAGDSASDVATEGALDAPVEASEDVVAEAGADAQLDVGPDAAAIDAAAPDAGAAPDAPLEAACDPGEDLCLKYTCGQYVDGCGVTHGCGVGMLVVSPDSMNYCDAVTKHAAPYYYVCDVSALREAPPPMPGCQRQVAHSMYFAWCCPM